jgi:hypothetical protein
MSLLAGLCYFLCCVVLLFSDVEVYKEGLLCTRFFIGVGNRDIMTKELSQICLFFVMSCLNIFSTWKGLTYVNPTLFFKQGMFCPGMFYTGVF